MNGLPPVEGREQLSAVTNLVIMSGSERDKAFVHLRKIVNISDKQEEAIWLAIKRRYESALINPYRKRRGRQPNQKNKQGHKAGRPKKKNKPEEADTNSLPNIFGTSNGNTAGVEMIAEDATNKTTLSVDGVIPPVFEEMLPAVVDDPAEQKRRDDALSKLQDFVESTLNGSSRGRGRPREL